MCPVPSLCLASVLTQSDSRAILNRTDINTNNQFVLISARLVIKLWIHNLESCAYRNPYANVVLYEEMCLNICICGFGNFWCYRYWWNFRRYHRLCCRVRVSYLKYFSEFLINYSLYINISGISNQQLAAAKIILTGSIDSNTSFIHESSFRGK